jgi:hypothetical protein
MPFVPLQIAKHGANSLSLDKFYRLRLSSAAMRELKLTAYQHVVLSVDVENKRLGIAKQELAKVPNATAVKPDKRGYLAITAGKQVAAKLGLTDADLPLRFADIGWIDSEGTRWRAFELSAE